ncbi:unnamed protein product, partial [Amoebophrya sp. A25]|eukprot:GSA25T00023780001.1
MVCRSASPTTKSRYNPRRPGATLFAEEINEMVSDLQHNRGRGGFFFQQTCSACNRVIHTSRTKFAPDERCAVCAENWKGTKSQKRHRFPKVTPPILSKEEWTKLEAEAKLGSAESEEARRRLAARGLTRTVDEISKNLEKQKAHLLDLCSRGKYTREFVPTVDLKTAVENLASAAVEFTWDKFGGFDAFAYQQKFEALQERHEKAQVDF